MSLWDLAGPIEFSAADIAWLLLAVTLSLSVLPAIAAAITYAYYRRQARGAPIYPSPLRRALMVFALAFVAQIAALWLMDWLSV